MQDKKTAGKQLICIGVIIIVLGLLFGYWSAFHAYAEESGEDTNDGDITEENSGIDIDEKLKELSGQIADLSNRLDDELERIDDDNDIIRNYLELEIELKQIEKQIDEITGSENTGDESIGDECTGGECTGDINTKKTQEETKAEEPVILDVETRFQYYPIFIVLMFCSLYGVFVRKV